MRPHGIRLKHHSYIAFVRGDKMIGKRRVVITGMGVISPVGNTVDEAWNSVKNGKSGYS